MDETTNLAHVEPQGDDEAGQRKPQVRIRRTKDKAYLQLFQKPKWVHLVSVYPGQSEDYISIGKELLKRALVGDTKDELLATRDQLVDQLVS